MVYKKGKDVAHRSGQDLIQLALKSYAPHFQYPHTILDTMNQFLSILAAATSLFGTTVLSNEMEPRQSTSNLWHVSDSYIGCGQGFCSYQFHISGNDTGLLPYFDAECTQQVGIGDTQFRQCQLLGAGSNSGKQVDGVYAYVALYPKNRLQSKLVVQLQFENPRLV